MEELKYRNNIEIKLLPNRRFIYSNRRQNIVITAEHLATEITVLFPDEYGDGYSKRVDFVNSQGKEWTDGLYIPEYKNYPPGYHRTRFHFSLPSEVTTQGELKMQFIAYKTDGSMITVPFEIITIDVLDGVPAFKKNARSNPDLLILSYNRSTEALFLAQQAKAKSIKAEERSAAAVETSLAAKAETEEALAVSNEAKEISERAEGKIDAAAVTAGAAVQSAARAEETSAAANTKADGAITAAGQAKSIAKQAKLTAATARDFAQSVVDRADNGDFKGPRGDKGDKGDKGTDGYMFAVDNLIGFYVDGDGGLYAYASENSSVDFRYDESTGNLYVVI